MTMPRIVHDRKGGYVQSELLFTPKLTGERFEQHTLPADVLSDIAALQEMLVSLAKAAYIAAEPGRVRSPRNFDKDVQLHLGPRGEGSTALPLMLVFSSGLLAPYRPVFETAQQQFTQAIDAAARGEAPQLAPKYLAYFDQIGRSLRTGEALMVPTAAGEASLTQDTRKRLIEASRVAEWTERATLRARIPATDYTADGFKAELLDGTVLPGKLDPTIQDQLAEAHYRYNSGTNAWLLLECVVRKERSGKLKAIDSIQQVSALDPNDIALRLHQLGQLQAGWLDGLGLAPPEAGLAWLSEAFFTQYSAALPLPRLYPTPKGGVLAEWMFGRQDVSLDIDLEQKTGEYDRLHLDTQDAEDETLPLASPADWERLSELLTALQEEQASGQ
jgi:hypothetical protein